MNLNNIDEKWLSDRLELVLTTQDIKKGLGIQFAKRFVSKIYDNKYHNYTLQNSLVIREYPISINRVNRSNKTKFIDLLYLDLDKNDNVVIGIENKFLTQDSKNQISDYKKTLEELYQNKDCKVKIVYLTLDGRPPINYSENNIICLSWTEDILIMLLETLFDCTIDFITKEIIEKWKYKRKNKLNCDIVDLINILIEIREIQHNVDIYLKTNIKDEDNEQKTNLMSAEYIKELLKIFDKTIRLKSIKINYLGKCYNLKYKSYQIFIPVSKNEEQIKHMIKYFCMSITNTDKLDNEYQNSINKISQDYIFDISNDVAKYEIAKYLNNNYCRQKCNKKDDKDE